MHMDIPIVINFESKYNYHMQSQLQENQKTQKIKYALVTK